MIPGTKTLTAMERLMRDTRGEKDWRIAPKTFKKKPKKVQIKEEPKEKPLPKKKERPKMGTGYQAGFCLVKPKKKVKPVKPEVLPEAPGIMNLQRSIPDKAPKIPAENLHS